jgi:radical SAM protein with 4Fe4S-binding SPASM domain
MKKFHQFVRVERGPINAAIIDILSGNVFHVPLDVVDRFGAGEHGDIGEFIEVAEEENLLIDIEGDGWIPPIYLEPDPEVEREKEPNIELHVEDGLPIREILDAFRHHSLSKIYYYGSELPRDFALNPLFELKVKDFQRCRKRTNVDGDFCQIQESIVRFNMRYNSCWGSVMAITGDGNIRPCIHSQQIIGHIGQELKDIDGLIKKMNPYWTLTKDKVERCHDCEFRYVCFDCREMAIRESGKMDGANPLCRYNPHTGEWKED